MNSKSCLIILILLFLSYTGYSQTYAFFGSYNHDKNKEGMYVYELDTVKGSLKKFTSAKIHNPSYLTLSPAGNFIYACTDTKTPNAGSVSSFVFNPEKKTITFVNSQSSRGENPVYCAVHPSGNWLINGNYTESGISLCPLNINGNIEPPVQFLRYFEGSINPDRQANSHIHSTVFSPDGKFVFVPDLGSDKIRRYEFDTLTKQPLLEIAPLKTTPGSGPRHFTFHPNGKYAYCIGELSGTVTVYQYSNGELKPVQEIATHEDSITEAFESSDVHCTPDGRFLYATNRGAENNIAIFSIRENGTLQNIGYQSTLGKHPRTFAIDSSGNFLIATNVNSSSAVVFRINKTTGQLTKTSETTIEHVSCVKIKNY
ncbi:lactonase family protein [Flavobacterium alkalisoli]|uniref:lactonase family protein n=1 Tax=Flavobacterium alkalisoli TaxID=2602769 RepID=UPI003A952CA6